MIGGGNSELELWSSPITREDARRTNINWPIFLLTSHFIVEAYETLQLKDCSLCTQSRLHLRGSFVLCGEPHPTFKDGWLDCGGGGNRATLPPTSFRMQVTPITSGVLLSA